MAYPLYYHVYLIKSDNDPTKFYKGFTTDITKRLAKHNNVLVKSITPYIPWNLQTVISVDSEDKVIQFERYLISHSGRAFSSKHF